MTKVTMIAGLNGANGSLTGRAMNRVDMLGGLAGGHHGIDARKANAALALHAEKGIDARGQNDHGREDARDVHLERVAVVEMDNQRRFW